MELYFKDRTEWRRWLELNSLKEKEVWLIYYKKPSGKPRIPYYDAVEEALCFGWIDGKIKRINDDYYIQRFTPRRKGSRWSKYNVERIERLKKAGLMKPEGLRVYREALEKPELLYDNRADGDPDVPSDLLSGLKANQTALKNFLNFSVSARRIYIEWLNSAKRPETRFNRIARIVANAEKNQRPGMM
jgi:uncharacterized protein YdeI (YjbR/CyaY-like superfamily)